jgi:Domain of unknown function (DUF1996)
MWHLKFVAAPAIVVALLLSLVPTWAIAHDTPDESDAEWQMLCAIDHQRADDPIVHPGHPGASHMHSFYGNTSTKASSTTASLMSARSNCGRNMETSDHSAYWVPALYKKNADGPRTLVTSRDQLMFIYYVRAGGPKGPKVEPFPAGLRMVTGDMNATSAQSSRILEWTCGGGGPTSGKIPSCSDPKQPIHASLGFPSCWDGKHLDSADHKSHMAYAADNGACPRTHPVSLPKVSYEIDYPGITGGPSYELASGGQYSMHGDFFAAWDARVQNALVSECLNDARDCIDINRSGNILFKPAGDPDPIPPINLANFSAHQTQVLAEPTSASPTPTHTHKKHATATPTATHKKHATPTPYYSASPAVAETGTETNAFPAAGVAGAVGGALTLALAGYLYNWYRSRRRWQRHTVKQVDQSFDYFDAGQR